MHHQSFWLWVLCLTGVDYFSTLGYQPSIAFEHTGVLTPLATGLLVLVTLLGALPIYAYVAKKSFDGQGSIAMLERLMSGWGGKLVVLLTRGPSSPSGPSPTSGAVVAIGAVTRVGAGGLETGPAQLVGHLVLEGPVVWLVRPGQVEASDPASEHHVHVVAGDGPGGTRVVDEVQAQIATVPVRHRQHRHPGAADPDDVTGPEAGQGGHDRTSCGRGAGGGPLEPHEPPVLLHVAPLAGRLALEPVERLGPGARPGPEPDDRVVGLVLGERPVEQAVGLVAVVAADQVGGHVVGRPEGGAQLEAAAGDQVGDLLERDVRAPQHQRPAELVDAPAPGPPGQLRVLARGERLVLLAGELGERLDDDRPGRHVDAEGEGLGGEHDLDEALRRSRPRRPP